MASGSSGTALPAVAARGCFGWKQLPGFHAVDSMMARQLRGEARRAASEFRTISGDSSCGGWMDEYGGEKNKGLENFWKGAFGRGIVDVA